MSTCPFSYRRLFVTLVACALVALGRPSLVRADNCDDIKCNKDEHDVDVFLACLSEKKACLTTKLSETQQQKNTLTNTISIITGKINLQELKIAQTQAEIVKLEKEIDELSDRINGLELSLDRLSSMLVERIRAQYKESRVSPFTALASSGSFSDMFAREQYVNQASQQTALAMQRGELQKALYDQEKSLKEEKQQQVEDKKKDLQNEQNVLAQQKASQQTILEETKNNEARYQQLLAEAQAQINSFKKFTSSTGTGGVIGADGLGTGYDGNYFSQRDERWANSNIGNSSEIIYNVGCLITSLAMTLKSKGADTNPGAIAANSSYFVLNTAYMKARSSISLPGGKSSYKINVSGINTELEKQNPVIVGLNAGPYGTHFVVLKKKDGDNWTMYDPWYGPDLAFTSHYSAAQIYSAEIIL